ncbi:MAG: plastocyanin/azurin family copper-binding protein [Burkholderiales bacterium]
MVLVVTPGIFLPRMASTREQAREVRLIARNMTYYVDGVSEPNPALLFLPGEQVRVTVRNEDKGMSHDFRIPAWGVGTKVVEWSTEKSITFRVPANASGGTYMCTPHSAMMSGKVVIK